MSCFIEIPVYSIRPNTNTPRFHLSCDQPLLTLFLESHKYAQELVHSSYQNKWGQKLAHAIRLKMEFSLNQELYLAVEMTFFSKWIPSWNPLVHSLPHQFKSLLSLEIYVFSLAFSLLESFNFFPLLRILSFSLLFSNALHILTYLYLSLVMEKKTHHFQCSLYLSSLSLEYLHQNILKCH